MSDIILTGPKHCGKTSAGKALASLCSGGQQAAAGGLCVFIDLDEEITRRAGKMPRELYNKSPAIFQKAESDALTALIEEGGADEGKANNRVIATGGGIVDNAQAVDLFKTLDAVIVYLNLSAATAWQRIFAGGELPPFLKTENPQETHFALHERRAAAYRQLADVVIDAERKTPQEIAAEIYNFLNS